MSRWLDVAVIPAFPWPNAPVQIPFDGETIVLMPSTDELACTASAFDPEGNLTFERGVEAVRRFLSSLAWSNRGGVVELFCLGTNHPDRPGLMGTGKFGRSYFQLTEPPARLYLPSTQNPRGRRALAVYREGLSINSEPFAFLSHFKVLNILFATGAPQKDWINAHLGMVSSYSAAERLDALRDVPDIGAYLYHQGRCAVAHAYDADVVDPDRFVETERLSLDLPLMQELAEICIEREFGILTDRTFWAIEREALRPSPLVLRNSGVIDGRHVYAPS